LEIPNSLELVGSPKLPSRYGIFTTFAYEDRENALVHIALVADSLDEVPIVRLHSECLTGDVFSSLRCDCGEQLRQALQIIGDTGGILIYLRQEGRGIGLANKIRAYSLQDEEGLDTVEANLRLGFPADPRTYQVAAIILAKLGIKKIKLLTNNPKKIYDLEKHGITVVERLPLVISAAPSNQSYLSTKRDKLKHLLP
jgi:3,4-dihydroxy 2-butanone 4-phosphate synthase / GTP cyclohydrolase II